MRAILSSLGTCALGAVLMAAPPPNGPQPPGHDPALAKPSPNQKGNALTGLGDPQKLGADLRLANPSFDPSLLAAPAGSANSQITSAAVEHGLAASLHGAGAGHDPALAKPDPSVKGNHLQGLADPQKLGAELRQSGPGHDRDLLSPLPGEKVNHLGPMTLVPFLANPHAAFIAVATFPMTANAVRSLFAEGLHDEAVRP